MVERVVIGFGSSIGDKIASITCALNKLNEIEEINILKISRLYQTHPCGENARNFFINGAVLISTELTPMELLVHLKRIETECGRIERSRWSDREIDLDILAYENTLLENERLSVPHKDLFLRDFALVPFLEIFGEEIHPRFQKKFSDITPNLDQVFIESVLDTQIVLTENYIVAK